MLVTPKLQEIGPLKELLNECMAMKGEPAELAEYLWDALGFGRATLLSLPSDHGDPSIASIENSRTEVARRESEESMERKAAAQKAKDDAKPGLKKKKRLFGWLGSEAPAPGGDDEDDDDRYKGGLR